MPHCPVTVVQRYRDGVCSLLFHSFFIICHPYIPLHLEEMTCNISRAITPTEKRYAQIQKEALAFTWACERLSDHLIGLRFHIQTDHNPLVPLFSYKNPSVLSQERSGDIRHPLSLLHQLQLQTMNLCHLISEFRGRISARRVVSRV